MFDESQPPSPDQALVSLPHPEHEWRPILHASNQVVLYNPTSHALTIHKSSSVPERTTFPCPYCRRPLPPDFGLEDQDAEEDRAHKGPYSRASNYFQLLAMSNETSRPSSPPSLESGSARSAFPRETLAEGYFKKFFQEEYRLGMGANGSVYLCQHMLDGNPLGHFAVKKIAVGESHSYLLSILREIRLLETLRHRNIITYHHAWLESCQFSSFGPKVPTLHVLMQWAESGSLDDLIDLRLGRPSKLPHMQSVSSFPSDTPSARIRAFRAMKRAPPEERERLRREMENKTASKIPGRPSWKAVHLLSAEEVQSLFSDVVEGLAFLHNKSILHLDLKPGNVLLTHDEGELIPRAMLSDFGTSRDMLQSSGSRSGNTGTLEYASPESLPAPQTGFLKQVDSKSDMWSLGMILHKMIFFQLPYRYASDEEEGSAADDTDKLNKLEKEILTYSGFRTTPSLSATFESRRLPRPFIILLETLLSVTPSGRPSCERILGAIREGRFNPVSPAPDSPGTSLIPVRRTLEEPDTDIVSDGPLAIAPASETGEQSSQDNVDSGNVNPDTNGKSPLKRLSLPISSDTIRQTFSKRIVTELTQATGLRMTKDAWIRTIKACILAVKAISIVSFWDVIRARPSLLTVLVVAALADPFSERLQVSLVLGVVHVGLVWLGRRVWLMNTGNPTYY